jgi:hypothetical protein
MSAQALLGLAWLQVIGVLRTLRRGAHLSEVLILCWLYHLGGMLCLTISVSGQEETSPRCIHSGLLPVSDLR